MYTGAWSPYLTGDAHDMTTDCLTYWVEPPPADTRFNDAHTFVVADTSSMTLSSLCSSAAHDRPDGCTYYSAASAVRTIWNPPRQHLIGYASSALPASWDIYGARRIRRAPTAVSFRARSIFSHL
jgi:hypothetical protein